MAADDELVDQTGRVEAGDALGGGQHAHRGDPAGVAAAQQAAREAERPAGGQHRVEDQDRSALEVGGDGVHVGHRLVGVLVAGDADEARRARRAAGAARR